MTATKTVSRVGLLIGAKKCAKEHGLYIVEKDNAFLIYRPSTTSERGILAARTTRITNLLATVKRCAASTPSTSATD